MMWRAQREEKLIAFLQGRLRDYSGKFLRKVLDANNCRINGQVERFGSRQLRRGDVIELSPKWKDLPKSDWTFTTLYEDDFLKIVNKPAGWVCDPKNVEKGFSLVHRLDKETTGALILAKKGHLDALFKLFEERSVEKEYLALVDGVPEKESGEIRSFLLKKGAYQGQTIWGSGPKGLTAITKWKRLASAKQSALILLEPETGRTHQIRVHMAEMGHPILIDRQYAKIFRSPLSCSRIMLHASRLRFSFQGKEIDVKAPLLPDMQNVLREAGYPDRFFL
ncbi:MAG: RluA family pseudouridine synthase [Parachlamydiales bacterium]|nr:RluA family pseudouridine synthase [Parachlamydiales bacterium]